MIRIIALAGVLLVLPLAVHAAELTVPKLPKAHRAVYHRRALPVHFGYYFDRFGSRSGGSAASWYGSTFALLAGSAGPGVLIASPKGVAAIHCPARRPLVCLAEPVVTSVGRR